MKYLLILFFCCSTCNATTLISGTRLIFDGNKNEASINITNKGKTPALIQSWIDDGNEKAKPNEVQVPFFIPNGLYTLPTDDSFTLRVFANSKTGSLPVDRETLFFLNIVDIPPKTNLIPSGQNAVVQFVVRSRLKLIYRPSSLKGDPNFALTHLTITKISNGIILGNPTPYYININNIRNSYDKKELHGPIIVPPLTNDTEVNVNYKSNLLIEAINDLGASVSRTFTM